MSVSIYREDGLASSTAIKGPCRAATTAGIALEGEQTVDGIACVTGDRVLVKNQGNPVENGIYVVDTGTWRRSADFEGNRDVRKGTRVDVTDGTTNGNTIWAVTTENPITIDITAITFAADASVAAAQAAAADAAQAALDKAAAEQAKTDAEAAQAAAEAALASAVNLLDGRVGVIDWLATKTPPTGYLAPDGSAVSRTTYAKLFTALVTNAGFSAQTFTVTIATPAVFTKTGHGFNGGERVRLSTTSALPSGLSTSVDYYVKYVDANTFQVSTTFEGSSVNTTGTQAGTHTYMQSLWGLGDGSTTFNLPLVNDDDRLVAAAGAGRLTGTSRAESVGPHAHVFVGDPLGNHNHGITGKDDIGGGASNVISFGGGPVAGDGNTTTGNASAGTPAGTIQNNSGTINLPPTIALLPCVYTGVV